MLTGVDAWLHCVASGQLTQTLALESHFWSVGQATHIPCFVSHKGVCGGQTATFQAPEFGLQLFDGSSYVNPDGQETGSGFGVGVVVELESAALHSFVLY